MRTINEEPVDGQGPALAITIEFGEQLKPYKSQNQFYINILEKSYREIRRAETLPLIRKAVEYLETHPFIAQDDEVLYAAQDYGIGEIKAGVLKTDDYSDKYSTYPDGFKHNAYGTCLKVKRCGGIRLARGLQVDSLAQDVDDNSKM